MITEMTLTEDILSQLPGNVLNRLREADRRWSALRNGTLPVPQVIETTTTALDIVDWDVVICGGTLGILLGATLQQKGWRVAVAERGILRGRDQEWNISRQELESFVNLGLLSPEELETAIATEYNPARVSFFQGTQLWIENILNVGVDPVFLLETLKTKFLAAGGKLLEKTAFEGATVHSDGVQVKFKTDSTSSTIFNTRLLLDAMGHFSPITQQGRQGQKPEGICLVVGSCAQGYPENDTGDILASFTPIQHQCQYFWEAFPARDGRTTYLFTYMDAHPQRFSLEFFLEEYFRLLPEYQNVELAQLNFKRVLFGFFPSYRESPLRLRWNRILPIGDSSGGQSPVSFGGFGSMVRHLPRLTLGIDEALKTDCLNRSALSWLQPYQPNISVTWLFQRTMSVGVEQNLSPNQINDLLNGVFGTMEQLGDEVLRPFLQDVVNFSGLFKTLTLMTVTKPQLIPPVISQTGIPPLLDWMVHYLNLGLYSGLSPLGKAIHPVSSSLPQPWKYYYHRWLEAWQYGSGQE